MISSWSRIDTLFRRPTFSLASALGAALLIASVASPAVSAEQITDRNVEAAVAAAKTPADHQALAAFFAAKADAAVARAKQHEQMNYAFTGKAQQSMYLNHRALAARWLKRARDYAALAKEQEKLAGRE